MHCKAKGGYLAGVPVACTLTLTANHDGFIDGERRTLRGSAIRDDGSIVTRDLAASLPQDSSASMSVELFNPTPC